LEIRDVMAHPVQLHEVYVEKLVCRRISGELPGLDTKVNLNMSTKAKVIDKETAFAFLTVTIETENLFHIELVLKGLCKTVTDVGKNYLRKFIDAQALPLLLPFARENIFTLLLRMGYPPLMLPTISVLDTIKKNMEQK
jgi:preprotein translocase subunit SecB